MSSPFDTFRKNRTYWMAGLVLLAILSFIVAPSIQMFLEAVRSGSPQGNQVVVRWAGGQLTQDNVTHLRLQHSRTMAFLQSVAREVLEKGGTPQVPGFVSDPQNKLNFDIGLPLMRSDREICQAMIIAERAKQLGLEFNDTTVKEYLNNFCNGKLSNQRLGEILEETAGRELSIAELHRQIGLALAQVVVQDNALGGVGSDDRPLVTPGVVWQNFVKATRVASVEAYPVLASEFVSQVKGTPSDAELKALYDAGSANYPSPNDPRPGFRRRYQASLEYASASWNEVTEQEKSKITEEQIKAEYDRLVALGGLKVPVDPPKPPAEDNSSRTLDKPAEGDTPPAPGKKADAAKPEAPAAPSTTEPSAATPNPADDKPAAEKPAQEKPAQEEPAQEKPATESPKLSSDEIPAGVRLVRFEQDEKPQEPKPADPVTTTPPAADPAKPSAENTPASSETAKATEPATPASSQPSTPDAATPNAVTSGQTAAPAPAEPAMRTKTLDEARAEIQTSLARDAARPLIEAKFKKLLEAMKEHSAAMAMDLASEKNNIKIEKTAKPFSLKKLADEVGLKYAETGMVDGNQLLTTPLGSSFLGRGNLANLVMWPEVPLYYPVQSIYINVNDLTNPDSQEFTSWKTRDEQAYTPAFSEIRDEVVQAWKLQEARKLAKEAAEKLSKEIAAAGENPWATKLDEQQRSLVVKTMPFTWLTPSRDMQSPPTISFVQGLDTVGNEFMAKVFSTAAGQMTVAPDEGQNKFYVIRVGDLSPNDEALRERFEAGKGMWSNRVTLDRARFVSDWYLSLERQLGVQWLAVDDSGSGAE